MTRISGLLLNLLFAPSHDIFGSRSGWERLVAEVVVER